MDSAVILSVLGTFAIICAVSGDTCISPSVQSKVHTSTDATVSQDTAFVVEFSITCKNGLKDLNLYAELNGQVLPTSKIQGDGKYKYQVSFSNEHKGLPAGHYSVRFFDEEGYSTLRKTQRSGEDISNVKSLFNVDFHHDGASQGMYVQSEFIAAAISVLVWYFAYNARNKLQSS